MLTETLIRLFERDLEKLKAEIAAYKSEEALWSIDKNILNSGGNLCLHLVGNLNTFIGAELGNTGYVRHRDQEFSLKDVPRSELVKMVDDTKTMVHEVLATLTVEDLDREFPKAVFGEPMTTEYFLVHLATHLDYHLGQINYHRRLLDE